MIDVKLKLYPGHTSERSWLEPSPLRALYWNVTYACNFRCPICFADAGPALPDELSTEEALRLVDHARECGVKGVIVSGGEPFARPDLLQILTRLAERGITVRIATNGSLLDGDLLSRLRGETSVKSFQVSLDCLDPELYARCHGTSATTLERVLANLSLMQEHEFHTTVSARLSPDTLPGIPALLDRAVRELWSTVTVHIPVHTRRTEGAFPQQADALSLLEPVLQHFAALPRRWLVETYIPWAEHHPVIARLAQQVRVVHRGCRAGRDRLAVHPDGGVSPCVCMDVPEARLGNVRRDSLLDLFERSPLCLMLRDPGGHGICADCAHVLTCGGGCRAAALAAGGRIDGEDVSCPLRQRVARASRAT